MRTYSRYEVARIIGARALQLANGAEPMIRTELKDVFEIAEEEFRQRACPIDTRCKE
jgi:DNA-directed RNA polymerase subunit K